MALVNLLRLTRCDRQLWQTSPTTASPMSFVLSLFLLCAVSLPTLAQAPPQSQPSQKKEPLGALTSAGETYVNDSPASGESTIFARDQVRTGQTGIATFTVSGKGTLKISPESRVVFGGGYDYVAELEAGTVTLSSIAGPNGVVLRVGNFVVVSSIRQPSATSRVTRAADGSFQVACLDGSVGVLTLESKSGQFLPAGQSLTASANAQLLPAVPSAISGRTFHPSWLLLGAGGAAAAGALAALGHGSSKQSISPSTP